jgi:hypothetical protein
VTEEELCRVVDGSSCPGRQGIAVHHQVLLGVLAEVGHFRQLRIEAVENGWLQMRLLTDRKAR